MRHLVPDPERPKCAELLKKPIDAPPTRSPQAVYSAVAHLLRDKDVVEIGTRNLNGDGMAFPPCARTTGLGLANSAARLAAVVVPSAASELPLAETGAVTAALPSVGAAGVVTS